VIIALAALYVGLALIALALAARALLGGVVRGFPETSPRSAVKLFGGAGLVLGLGLGLQVTSLLAHIPLLGIAAGALLLGGVLMSSTAWRHARA
jgi:hypothetical protein